MTKVRCSNDSLTTFDDNINSSEDVYWMTDSTHIKKVHFDRPGCPGVYRSDYGQAIQFLSLHFQGSAKKKHCEEVTRMWRESLAAQ